MQKSPSHNAISPMTENEVFLSPDRSDDERLSNDGTLEGGADDENTDDGEEFFYANVSTKDKFESNLEIDENYQALDEEDDEGDEEGDDIYQEPYENQHIKHGKMVITFNKEPSGFQNGNDNNNEQEDVSQQIDLSPDEDFGRKYYLLYFLARFGT